MCKNGPDKCLSLAAKINLVVGAHHQEAKSFNIAELLQTTAAITQKPRSEVRRAIAQMIKESLKYDYKTLPPDQQKIDLHIAQKNQLPLSLAPFHRPTEQSFCQCSDQCAGPTHQIKVTNPQLFKELQKFLPLDD